MMPIFDEDSMDSKNTSMSGSQHLSSANNGGGSNSNLSGMSKAEIRKVN